MSTVHDQALDDIIKSIARFASESQFGSLEHAISAYERICAARQKSFVKEKGKNYDENL